MPSGVKGENKWEASEGWKGKGRKKQLLNCLGLVLRWCALSRLLPSSVLVFLSPSLHSSSAIRAHTCICFATESLTRSQNGFHRACVNQWNQIFLWRLKTQLILGRAEVAGPDLTLFPPLYALTRLEIDLYPSLIPFFPSIVYLGWTCSQNVQSVFPPPRKSIVLGESCALAFPIILMVVARLTRK